MIPDSEQKYDRERTTVKIEKAENGFVVEKTVTDNSKYYEPEPMVFNELSGVIGYLEKCFGSMNDKNKSEDTGEEETQMPDNEED